MVRTQTPERKRSSQIMRTHSMSQNSNQVTYPSRCLDSQTIGMGASFDHGVYMATPGLGSCHLHTRQQAKLVPVIVEHKASYQLQAGTAYYTKTVQNSFHYGSSVRPDKFKQTNVMQYSDYIGYEPGPLLVVDVRTFRLRFIIRFSCHGAAIVRTLVIFILFISFFFPLVVVDNLEFRTKLSQVAAVLYR